MQTQPCKLYVGNLSFKATISELETLFSEYGELVDVKIITHRDSGRSKGFGFVEFKEASAAESALKLNDQEFQGRKLIVNVAQAQQRRSGGNGGGGYNDRGGRGGRRSYA